MDIKCVLWYNRLSNMGNEKKDIIISIENCHLPLLKESSTKSTYSEKIAFDATHSYNYKVSYNPKMIRLLLSHERYFQDVVDYLMEHTSKSVSFITYYLKNVKA